MNRKTAATEPQTFDSKEAAEAYFAHEGFGSFDIDDEWSLMRSTDSEVWIRRDTSGKWVASVILLDGSEFPKHRTNSRRLTRDRHPSN